MQYDYNILIIYLYEPFQQPEMHIINVHGKDPFITWLDTIFAQSLSTILSKGIHLAESNSYLVTDNDASLFKIIIIMLSKK